LSGLRVAYAVGNPEMIRPLAIDSPPWIVSSVAQLAAIRAFDSLEYYQDRYGETLRLRDEMSQQLKQFADLSICCLAPNSILLKLNHHKVHDLSEFLISMGIYIRDFSNKSEALSGEYFRIGIKCREENQTVIGAIAKYFERSA
jgi:histidinol-phosphate/aromatic aminotransferase/cobyric acid decarboxylase-like protein